MDLLAGPLMADVTDCVFEAKATSQFRSCVKACALPLKKCLVSAMMRVIALFSNSLSHFTWHLRQRMSRNPQQKFVRLLTVTALPASIFFSVSATTSGAIIGCDQVEERHPAGGVVPAMPISCEISPASAARRSAKAASGARVLTAPKLSGAKGKPKMA